MPVCSNCKQQCGYYEQYGLFYCNACDTQSQTMQVMTADDEVPTTKVSSVHSHRVKQKQVHKTSHMRVKMNIHKKTIPGAWKYQAMQQILQAQVKTLIEMGVTERLNDVVAQLWKLYLHKLNIAFYDTQKKNGDSGTETPKPEQSRSLEQDIHDSEPGSPSIISKKVIQNFDDIQTPKSPKQDDQTDDLDNPESSGPETTHTKTSHGPGTSHDTETSHDTGTSHDTETSHGPEASHDQEAIHGPEVTDGQEAINEKSATEGSSTEHENVTSDLVALLMKIRKHDGDEIEFPVPEKRTKRSKRAKRSKVKSDEDPVPEKGTMESKKTTRRSKVEGHNDGIGFGGRKKNVCLRNLLCLLYLGLRFVHEPILLSDLIRLVEENKLPFWYSEDIVSQDLMKENPHEFRKLLCESMKGKITYSHSGFMARLVIVKNQLGLPRIPCPNMPVVIARYIAMLNLPRELHHITYELFRKYNPSLDMGVFAHDIIALAFIIVTLKLVFSLDDKNEHERSEKARRLREKMTTGLPIFVWDEWVCSVEIRKSQRIAEGYTTDFSDVSKVQNVDNFLKYYMKCSRTEDIQDLDVKCSKRQNKRGGSQDAWEMRLNRQKCFKFLDKDDNMSDESAVNPKVLTNKKRKSTLVTTDDTPKKKRKTTYKLQQVCKSTHYATKWASKEHLLNVDYSQFSVKYILDFDHFCEDCGLENDKQWLLTGKTENLTFDLKLPNMDSTSSSGDKFVISEVGEIKNDVGKKKKAKSKRKQKKKREGSNLWKKSDEIPVEDQKKKSGKKISATKSNLKKSKKKTKTNDTLKSEIDKDGHSHKFKKKVNTELQDSIGNKMKSEITGHSGEGDQTKSECEHSSSAKSKVKIRKTSGDKKKKSKKKDKEKKENSKKKKKRKDKQKKSNSPNTTSKLQEKKKLKEKGKTLKDVRTSSTDEINTSDEDIELRTNLKTKKKPFTMDQIMEGALKRFGEKKSAEHRMKESASECNDGSKKTKPYATVDDDREVSSKESAVESKDGSKKTKTRKSSATNDDEEVSSKESTVAGEGGSKKKKSKKLKSKKSCKDGAKITKSELKKTSPTDIDDDEAVPSKKYSKDGSKKKTSKLNKSKHGAKETKSKKSSSKDGAKITKSELKKTSDTEIDDDEAVPSKKSSKDGSKKKTSKLKKSKHGAKETKSKKSSSKYGAKITKLKSRRTLDEEIDDEEEDTGKESKARDGSKKTSEKLKFKKLKKKSSKVSAKKKKPKSKKSSSKHSARKTKSESEKTSDTEIDEEDASKKSTEEGKDGSKLKKPKKSKSKKSKLKEASATDNDEMVASKESTADGSKKEESKKLKPKKSKSKKSKLNETSATDNDEIVTSKESTTDGSKKEESKKLKPKKSKKSKSNKSKSKKTSKDSSKRTKSESKKTLAMGEKVLEVIDYKDFISDDYEDDDSKKSKSKLQKMFDTEIDEDIGSRASTSGEQDGSTKPNQKKSKSDSFEKDDDKDSVFTAIKVKPKHRKTNTKVDENPNKMDSVIQTESDTNESSGRKKDNRKMSKVKKEKTEMSSKGPLAVVTKEIDKRPKKSKHKHKEMSAEGVKADSIYVQNEECQTEQTANKPKKHKKQKLEHLKNRNKTNKTKTKTSNPKDAAITETSTNEDIIDDSKPKKKRKRKAEKIDSIASDGCENEESCDYSLLEPNPLTGKYEVEKLSESMQWVLQLFTSMIGVETQNLLISIYQVELLVFEPASFARKNARANVLCRWGCRL